VDNKLPVEPKRILILTADVGFGHRSAANAVAAALQDNWGDECIIEISNPIDDERTPSFLRDAQTDYDKLVRENPEWYRLRYEMSDNPLPNAIYESVVTVSLYKVVAEVISCFKPNAIVITHPFYPAPVSAVLAVHKLAIPVITIVTDLVGIHISWFNSGSDRILVPTTAGREEAIASGLPGQKVQVTGIPVNPSIVKEDRDKAAIRSELGWDPNMTTVLAVGSKRVKNLEEVLNVLNHSGFPIQLVIVAGGDDKAYDCLKATKWHLPVYLYNFVKNMPAFLRASDIILSKAGGLIVTESLAAGLAMLLVDVTPGQEEGNAQYVVDNGAGEIAETPLDVLETMAHWLADDKRLLAERCRNAAKIGRPDSAYAIADLVYSAASRRSLHALVDRTSLLPKLMRLLNSFGLRQDENVSQDENISSGDEYQAA
jgi:1,2-diacylglycerol 3-beta-galactosyltransferase